METLTFKLQEDNFEGPLDLLLYLVGKNKDVYKRQLRHLRMGHHLPPLYFPRSPCYARQSKKVSQTPKTFKKLVDKYPTPCYNNICRRLKSQPRQSIWGFSSAGRALAWHARGHRFDPGNLHQKAPYLVQVCLLYTSRCV